MPQRNSASASTTHKYHFISGLPRSGSTLPIKELVRKVDLAELTEAMTGWLGDPSVNLREALTQWASEREIETD